MLIKNILSIFKSDYLRATYQVSLGNLIAQVINFAFNYILARLYGPAEYGLFAVYNYLLGLLLVFGNLKLDINVVIDFNENKLSKLFNWSFFLSLIFSVFSVFIFFLYSQYNNYQFSYWWYLIFFSSYILMINNQMNWMALTRMKQYEFIGRWRIIESLIANISMIALHSLHAIGIAMGYLISNLMILVGLSNKTGMFKFINIHNIKSTDHEIIEDIKNNRFIIYQSILEVSQFSLIPIFFSEHLNIVGMYSMSIRILQVPVRILILPLTQIFMNRMSEMIHQKKTVKNFYVKNIYLTTGILIPIFAIIFFGGEYIFEILLGKNWLGTMDIAGIILIWILFDTLKAPFVQIFYILKKQKIYFYFYFVMISLMILLNYICDSLGVNAYTKLFIISIVMGLMSLLIILYTYKLINLYERSVFWG